MTVIHHTNPNAKSAFGSAIVMNPGVRANNVNVGGVDYRLWGSPDKGRQVWYDPSRQRGGGGAITIGANGQTYNYTPEQYNSLAISGGGGGHGSPAQAAGYDIDGLGLGGAIPAFETVSGQEQFFSDHNDELFGRFQDIYDPVIQAYLGDINRSRLNYLQAPGTGDIAQKTALGPINLRSGVGLGAMRNRGSVAGRGQATNAATAFTKDELGRLSNQLDAVGIGNKLNDSFNKAVGSLAQSAAQAGLGLGETELGLRLKKSAHDTKLELAALENETARKLANFDDDLGYYQLGGDLISGGIDWLFNN